MFNHRLGIMAAGSLASYLMVGSEFKTLIYRIRTRSMFNYRCGCGSKFNCRIRSGSMFNYRLGSGGVFNYYRSCTVTGFRV